MIELSADLGEASSDAERDVERVIWTMVDAANVACGGHAGDETTMRAAVRAAAHLGVILGAHPSYPDREHFGRLSIKMDREQLRRSLTDQIAALEKLAAHDGVRLQRVKAHGALYNDAHKDPAIAGVLVAAIKEVSPALAIVAPQKSQMAVAAAAAGLQLVREAFADRRYRPDGSLVPRGERDALLSVADAAAQAESLATAHAVDARGHRLAIEFDTICVHADMDNSVERLKSIRQRLAPFVRMTSE